MLSHQALHACNQSRAAVSPLAVLGTVRSSGSSLEDVVSIAPVSPSFHWADAVELVKRRRRDRQPSRYHRHLPTEPVIPVRRCRTISRRSHLPVPRVTLWGANAWKSNDVDERHYQRAEQPTSKDQAGGEREDKKP